MENHFSINPNQIEAILVDCFNYKASMKDYWLHDIWEKKPFSNLQDIENAFKIHVARIMNFEYLIEHSTSPEPCTTEQLYSDKEINVVMSDLYMEVRESEEWRKLYEDVLRSKGFDADMKLAALVNYFSPEHIDKYYALDKVDLRLSSVFSENIVPKQALSEKKEQVEVDVESILTAIKEKKLNIVKDLRTTVSDLDDFCY